MEVQFTPEIEKKLNELAIQRGRPAGELVQEAVACMFDELTETRATLNRRYDEIKGGKVRMVPGDEAFARLMAKTEAERNRAR